MAEMAEATAGVNAAIAVAGACAAFSAILAAVAAGGRFESFARATPAPASAPVASAADLEVELSTATAAYGATAASFILGVLEFARLALAAELATGLAAELATGLATELATGLATGRFVMGAGASEGAAVATETALSTTIGGSAGDGCCCCCGGGSGPGFCGAACDASGCEEFGGGTANRTAGSRRRIQTRTELPVRMYTPHGQSSVGRQG